MERYTKNAYLTIDDGPTERTRLLIDYLEKKSIAAIMFFVGKNIETHREDAIQAVRHGMLIGNHSYSHPHFSALTFEQAVDEIEMQESLIDGIYHTAGCTRPAKLFRFPFGDKGGKNRERIQTYLMESSFSQLDSHSISYPWYDNLRGDQDIFWTFDYEEYRLHNDQNPIKEDFIYAKMENEHSTYGGCLKDKNSDEIILIHDHPITNSILPNYFEILIGKAIEIGIEFCEPKFEPRNL